MIKLVQHKDLDSEVLYEIVAIKKLSWNYSVKQHLDWLEKNIRDNDYHFLLYENDKLVAYVNLVHVVVSTGYSLSPFLGIGNVCARERGLGYGKSLMIELGNYLIENDLKGLLFCREHLIRFYKKFGWKSINNLYPNASVCTMVFNCDLECTSFEKVDRLF